MQVGATDNTSDHPTIFGDNTKCSYSGFLQNSKAKKAGIALIFLFIGVMISFNIYRPV